MKPIDDPRFAAAVRLFEQEYAMLKKADFQQGQLQRTLRGAAEIHKQANAAKPSPQIRYHTMNKLRMAVFARLDGKAD